MQRSFLESFGEGLARNTNRRKFLRRGSAALFGFVAAGMAELTIAPNAYAIDYCTNSEEGYSCNPPGGKYCDVYNSSYCSGPNCVKPCSLNYTWWSNTACWCTNVACAEGGGVYYECCDCSCPGVGACGCHQAVHVGGCIHNG